ncbi:unnamed protein product [Oncorhynchus mykiss]|uniref:Uncharacterized protein n=1 Tax=Oncorhynchus mykiss TaxID=8022 RepID=A0A060Y1Y9_ONCMY|nr:unnamed protein product [Oncorhynchus mykiss]
MKKIPKYMDFPFKVMVKVKLVVLQFTSVLTVSRTVSASYTAFIHLCTPPVLNICVAHPNFGSPAYLPSLGTNQARPGAFPGTNSPGPVADLYGTTSQDSGVGNYISAASPQPGSGFGHSIAGPLIATAFTNGYH